MRLAVLCLAALALTAVGCGGDDGDSASSTATAEWAEGYCAAITDWANELKQATDQLRDFKSLSRESFQQAGKDIDSATETFTGELRALGAPDTKSGEKAREVVETFATAAEADLVNIESAVDNVSGVAGISKAVVSITDALTSMNKAFMNMVKSLQRIDPEEELQSALEDSESCHELAA